MWNGFLLNSKKNRLFFREMVQKRDKLQVFAWLDSVGAPEHPTPEEAKVLICCPPSFRSYTKRV